MTRLGHAPDDRQYDIAISALKDLNVCAQVHLIGDNLHKREQLEAGGFTVIEQVKLGYHLTPLTQNELLARIQWLVA
jgi:GTP cyclohydrolase II